MWWVLGAAVAADLRVIASGDSVVYMAAGRRGAEPGEAVVFGLNFESGEAMRAAPSHTSHFAANDTDLLYMDTRLARVPTDGDADVLSAATLGQVSAKFGVCEGVLHLDGIPVHCKRGAAGSSSCELAAGGCKISLHATQHAGVCGKTASYGDLAVTLPCGDTTVSGHPVAAVKAGAPRLSVHQLGASWEYDGDVGVLTVWLPRPPSAAWDGMAATVGLTLFLALWQSWIRRLHALDGTDCIATDRVWSTLTWYSVAVADVLLFSVATKVSGLVLQSRAFLPEAAGRVLGDLTFMYNYLYVGATCLAASFAATILWLMWVSRPGTVLADGRVKELAARVCAAPARESRVITLRWLVDTIVLTTLHVSVPEALGARLRASLGLLCGLAVAVVTGRDATLLLRDATVLQSALTAAMAFFAVSHVALFMALESFSQARTAHQPLPLMLSFLVSLQAAGAGAVWSRRGLPGRPRGLGGQSPKAM